ncbi:MULTISPECIES: urease accessory protein UreD [Actinosynnema]|uniref:urease accessory protein UreD n=1 Tax=Actinosynnema TaxID=40566 RepID=UPI0020A26800|nr:urease accessory protein UreD [Actinosynnema pretiosum]MCP2095854.1 urease accessory protein [Actinosynnema pretiosum]
MKAFARLVAERNPNGRTVIREMRSAAPLTLVPARGARSDAHALVHLVSSITAPLGGDELELRITVGPGAALVLRGVAATVALPGHRPGGSRSRVLLEVAEGGSVEHLPEPTVVTARADHEAVLEAELAEGARLRAREVLVLGRLGERPGRLTTTTSVRRGGPLLRQSLTIGDERGGPDTVDTSPAGLAGRRVIGAEVLCWGEDPAGPVSGDWWSLVPLARGGSLATALGDTVIEVERALTGACGSHPGSSELLTRSRARFRADGHTLRVRSHRPGGSAQDR